MKTEGEKMQYDLFAHLFKEIANKIEPEAPKDLAKRLSGYEKNRDLGKILSKLLGLKLSPGLNWQVSEISHATLLQNVDQKIQEIDKDIREHNRNRDRATDQRVKNKLVNQIKELKSLKNILKNFRDTKPVWGQPAGSGFLLLSEYTMDDDNTRSKEAKSFPPICFRLRLEVPMKSPIIIRGDRPLVANENPFCTEKVTGWPLIRPNSLKGQARHATFAVLDDKVKIDRLFGSANEEKDEGLKSRVEFLPCYLKDLITFDIKAPHEEERRRIKKTGPVTLEILNTKTLILWLQYWPLDHLNSWVLSREGVDIKEALLEDFFSILKGLNYWFKDVGIGSKTPEGFGRVKWDKAKVSLFSAEQSPWRLLGEELLKKNRNYVLLRTLADEKNHSTIRNTWEEAWQAFT